MTNKRKPRDAESRTGESRKSDSYVPETRLPVPDPVPGWRFKWIRTASYDKIDNKNVSRRFREGWVPVKAEEVPKLQALSDENSRWPDSVEMEGLLLCKIPEEKAAARNEYYGNQSEAQLHSVDQGFLKDQHASMPKHIDRKTRTSFGNEG